MTQLIDEQGRLPMPQPFKAGDAVEVEFDGADRLVIRRLDVSPNSIKLVMNADGTSVITGLPKFETADVRRFFHDGASK